MTATTLDHPSTSSDHFALLAPTEGYPWYSLPLDPERLSRYLGTCLAQGVGYELGAKAHDLEAVPPDYHAIDSPAGCGRPSASPPRAASPCPMGRSSRTTGAPLRA